MVSCLTTFTINWLFEQCKQIQTIKSFFCVNCQLSNLILLFGTLFPYCHFDEGKIVLDHILWQKVQRHLASTYLIMHLKNKVREGSLVAQDRKHQNSLCNGIFQSQTSLNYRPRVKPITERMWSNHSLSWMAQWVIYTRKLGISQFFLIL